MKPLASPFSDRTLDVQTRSEVLSFRKEEFEIVYHYYEDEGHEFTTDEVDSINLKQLYNFYREKHNLPFPETIKAIREKYQLSATKMAEVLGFGINVYRQYENGEIPSQSNARLIQLASELEEFKKLILLSGVFQGKDLDKVLHHIDKLQKEEKNFSFKRELIKYVLGVESLMPSRLNGFTIPDIAKAIDVICYLINALEPSKTVLNKLLFYTDFIHYRHHGKALIGLEYKAIEFGTVPLRYDSLYEYIAEEGYIERKPKEFASGYVGEVYNVLKDDASSLTEDELTTLAMVCDSFKNKKAREIVEINHQELAWKENQAKHDKIDYRHAFRLNL